MFALFEFVEDKSVEVGDVTFIEGYSSVKNWDDFVANKTVVKVAWPSTSSSSKSKSKKNGSDADVFEAILLAVDTKKSKVIARRNRVCRGENMETDLDTGRGKRKKERSYKYITSSSDSESDEEPQKKQHKSKSKQGKVDLNKSSEMACQLKQQLLTDNKTGGDSSDDEAVALSGKESKDGKALQALRVENAIYKKQLEFLKDLPCVLMRIEKFLSSQEQVKAQRKVIEDRFTPPSPVSCSSPTVSGSSPTVSGRTVSQSTCSSISSPEDSGPDDQTVSLSPSVLLKRSQLSKCNSSDYRKLTSNLLVVLFGRRTLAACSLTGAANNSGVKKPALAENKVEALVGYVSKKFAGVTEQQIRQVITNKLSNEAKLQKKSEIGENKDENVKKNEMDE